MHTSVFLYVIMPQLSCWNIHGFHVDKINEVLANTCSNYDIFGIVESWTSGESNMSLPGYSQKQYMLLKQRVKEAEDQVVL